MPGSITKIFITSLLLVISWSTIGQSLHLYVDNEPLNKVLLELRDAHGVQFSFNDKLIEECLISDSATYNNPKEAVISLAKRCDFELEIKHNVFVIYERKPEESPPEIKTSREYSLRGKIVDTESRETLPFAAIRVNKSGVVSDVNGHFTYAGVDSTIAIMISYVGYQILDTILESSSIIHTLKLAPQSTKLKEVVISSDSSSKRIYGIVPPMGTQVGLLKLNSSVASLLPGSSDNTIFNLVRLQPGILAAGEQTKDYITWGSYKGQTQIVFDGITLFSVSSENDNIGAINPLMVKDIEVHKGGYNVHLGDRVGGLVNITGTDGNYQKTGVNVKLTNETVAGILNVPVSKRSSIQGAYRKTYYAFGKLIRDEGVTHTNFTDINLKYSGESKKGSSYSISLLTSGDRLDSDVSKDRDFKFYSRFNSQIKNQFGVAGYYGKHWKKAGVTHLTLASSFLDSRIVNRLSFIEKETEEKLGPQGKLATKNEISETSFKINHVLPITRNHNFSFGVNLLQNKASYSLDSISDNLKTDWSNINRIATYVKDKMFITKKLHLEPGLKVDLPLGSPKPFIQPRLNVSYIPGDRWRVNLAWGVYNQFVVENTAVDEFGNQIYFWSIADGFMTHALNAVHTTGGLSYNHGRLNVNVEGFHKVTNNQSRYFFDYENQEVQFSEYGISRSYGLDFFIKRQFYKHELWLAYTLGRTEEFFDYFESKEYQRASHDQLHELKSALLLDFSPVYVSLNYVYGSGIQNISQSETNETERFYSRLDVAAMCQLNLKKVKLETGVSIINLLNTANVRYNNFSAFHDNNIEYTEATPFTPSVFLNIKF